MRVFITGGTGLIGSAVVAELLGNGHTVLALARSEASARAAESAGATPIRGDLAGLDVLRAAALDSDSVIHLAFDHDFSTAGSVERSVAEETAALLALTGTGRRVVTVAGTPHVPGRPSTESDPANTDGPVGGRGRTVNAVLAKGGVAIRLPRTVHDNGEGGFAGILTGIARQTGVVGYPGDGTQRWPAVHAKDAAVLFRLALEKAPPGTAWHAVADEGDAVKDIAEVIARRLHLPAKSQPEDAFGPLGTIFATDQPASSAHTREALGWHPAHPGLLADLENLNP